MYGGLLATGAALFFIGLALRGLGIRKGRDVWTVLSAAGLEAGLRKHEHTTIEHVALALSFDESIESCLVADGIELAALRDKLQEHLGPTVLSLDAAAPLMPRLDGRMKAILRAATAGHLAPTVTRLLDAIASGPDSLARTLLRGASGAATAPKVAATAPASARSPYRAAPSRVRLRFWNDKRTPIAFVCAALIETCGLEAARAHYLVYRVHFAGSADVGEWPQADADAFAAKVTTAARAAGFPLRVTVVPPSTLS